MDEAQYRRETEARLQNLSLGVAGVGQRLANSHNLLSDMLSGLRFELNLIPRQPAPDPRIDQILTRLSTITAAQSAIQQQITQSGTALAAFSKNTGADLSTILSAVNSLQGAIGRVLSVATTVSLLETQMLTMQESMDAQGVTLSRVVGMLTEMLKPRTAITTGKLAITGHQPEPIAKGP